MVLVEWLEIPQSAFIPSWTWVAGGQLNNPIAVYQVALCLKKFINQIDIDFFFLVVICQKKSDEVK